MSAGAKTAPRTSVARTVFYNVLVFFVLFNVLYWLIPTFNSLQRLYFVARQGDTAQPPVYSAQEIATWARKHFEELSIVRTKLYRSFVGWQTPHMRGETINIEGPYHQRRTVNPSAAAQTPKVSFFGGSTLWGMGTSDALTIPSQFASITGLHTENFAEVGWSAHQNLLRLIELIQAGHRPDIVVFFDGVNDTHQKCRIELRPEAHEREVQFDTALRRSLTADTFAHYSAPLEQVAANVKREVGRGGGAEEYDCHTNAQKAEAVAEGMVRDWQLANQLVEAYGGRFIGLLQPVAYLSRTRLDHMSRSKLQPRREPPFHAVYPLIRAKLSRSLAFVDITDVLDRDEPLYYDFCHLGVAGNHLIAQRAADIVKALALKSVEQGGSPR